MKRSESWKHIFDTKTGFIRGKKVDGSFIEPFDPITWGDPYVEGAAWQHRFDAPHDVESRSRCLAARRRRLPRLKK